MIFMRGPERIARALRAFEQIAADLEQGANECFERQLEIADEMIQLRAERRRLDDVMERTRSASTALTPFLPRPAEPSQ